MTARTRYACVTVLQQEVCIAMIKRCKVQHYNVGFSSLVIGMTGFTFCILYVRQVAVITLVAADIGIDVLVTIPAKIGLCAFTKVSMAA